MLQRCHTVVYVVAGIEGKKNDSWFCGKPVPEGRACTGLTEAFPWTRCTKNILRWFLESQAKSGEKVHLVSGLVNFQEKVSIELGIVNIFVSYWVVEIMIWISTKDK